MMRNSLNKNTIISDVKILLHLIHVDSVSSSILILSLPASKNGLSDDSSSDS